MKTITGMCLLSLAVFVGALAYLVWLERKYPPETTECQDQASTSPRNATDSTVSQNAPGSPGPVAPYPPIGQFVRAKIIQECVEEGLCLTWNRLRDEFGVELVCKEHIGRYSLGRPTNWGGLPGMMPCSKVVKVKLREGIEVGY